MAVGSRAIQSTIETFVKSNRGFDLLHRASSPQCEAVDRSNDSLISQDLHVFSNKMSRSRIETYFAAKANGCPHVSVPAQQTAIHPSHEKLNIFSSEELIEPTLESILVPRAMQHSNNEITSNGCITYQRRAPTAGQKRKNLSNCLVDNFEENEAGTLILEVSEKTEDTSSLAKSNNAVSFLDSSLQQCWEKFFGIKRTQAPKRISGQYYLDLGQADFSFTTCSLCGLMYAPGHENDEKVHSTFHKNHLQGIQFKGWQKERVAKHIDNKGDRIILVLPDDPPQQQYKVKEVVAIMECEMGLSLGWLLHSKCKIYLYVSYARKVVGCVVAEPIKKAFRVVLDSSCSGATSPLDCINNEIAKTKAAPTGYPKVNNNFRACSPLAGNKIACCREQAPNDSEKHLLDKDAPSLDEADPYNNHKLLKQYQVEPASKSRFNGSETDQVSGSKHASEFLVFGNIKFSRKIEQKIFAERKPDSDVEDLGRAILCSKVAVPASCGVRGIWVTHSERRKGIASQLLNVLRKTFCVGSVLQPSQCAFSQPTPDGKAFAERYCDTTEFLVYR